VTDLEEVTAHDYEIIRHKETEHGTFGRMYDAAGLEVCVTLERPWVDADANGKRDEGVSRFVPGLYRCFLRKSHEHGGDGKRSYDVWQFERVPDTKAAQLHIANLVHELEGCVGTGSAFGDVNGQPGIQGSEAAFKKFMRDSLALCARETRDHIWIRVSDRLS
jgi:hypothetical protein